MRWCTTKLDPLFAMLGVLGGVFFLVHFLPVCGHGKSYLFLGTETNVSPATFSVGGREDRLRSRITRFSVIRNLKSSGFAIGYPGMNGTGFWQIAIETVHRRGSTLRVLLAAPFARDETRTGMDVHACVGS